MGGALTKHTGWAASVPMSDDGRRVFSGSSGKSMPVWDVDARNQSGALTGHAGWVVSVEMSAD